MITLPKLKGRECPVLSKGHLETESNCTVLTLTARKQNPLLTAFWNAILLGT